MKGCLKAKGMFTAMILSLSLSLSCSPLLAANIRWQWNDVDATSYRWQLDGEAEDGWTVVDGNTLHADTPDLDSSRINRFYIQSSHDGLSWSDSFVETWGEDEEIEEQKKVSHFGMRAALSPYSIDIFDFYNGHHVADARFLTHTSYSTSIDTEFYYRTPWPLSLHLDAGYNLGIKKETVERNAYDVHFIRLGGGIDGVVANEKLSFSFGILGGEMISFNADSWNSGSYLGGRLLLEFNITESLLLGLQSKATVSYQKTRDPLLSSLTWIVDPVSLTIAYRF